MNYTPIINGRGLTEETGTIGWRFGADKKFGFLIGGSYDWNGRGIDDIEPVPDGATLPDGTTKGRIDGHVVDSSGNLVRGPYLKGASDGSSYLSRGRNLVCVNGLLAS